MDMPQVIVAGGVHEIKCHFDGAADRVLYYCPTCGRIDYRRHSDLARLFLVQGDPNAIHSGGSLGALSLGIGLDGSRDG